ncbi:sensor histidine kinase [Clostridium estertheticum]|uniref:sensor histidine kinase n=1 Tax=Clostridium estertheticum TaxID=238834 RepID=UPI001CF387BB|nr:sensor histidine kinase [Clostridium estertheticum]MCB2305492.1 sensor histidine kinase [Clostridium estertheticum]MCB2343931.1 sensor histidine kinase [Clostridium estertheticum]MCB2348848.1 sensor histidine kinase [Clostridium estertheticum]WAG46168.1 sensor histidine kinase [Clostridium estertheticum]
MVKLDGKRWENTAITRITLFVINFLMIVFMSIISSNTIGLICENSIAREFIEKIKSVPTVAWKMPVFAMLLLFMLSLGVIVREMFFMENQLVLYIFCIYDILLCILIMGYLNMDYKGILFIAIANIVIYINGKKRKSMFILVIIIIYIILDYNILSIKVNIFNINDYAEYYTSLQRIYYYSIKNILNSTNDIIFILFMIQVIQSERDENEKISELYGELYKSSEELKVINIQLQDYARKSQETAKIKERNRLAREIHDTIGHTLTGIAIGLEACIELSEFNISKMKIQMLKISELARKGLLDVRRSMNELRPDALERFSLIEAISKLSEDINECTNTKVKIQITGQDPKMGADEEETVYRIVQEGITNAVRHGEASEIIVALKFEENKLQIKIRDDGIGVGEIKEGFGLRHVEERVEMIGGKVHFWGAPSEGFIISAYLPIRRKIKND